MRIINPIAIGEAELLSSNVIDDLPFGTSALSYPVWNAATSYSVGDTVCWIVPESSGTPTTFGIYTSSVSSNINREPGKYWWGTGGDTLPGVGRWTLKASYQPWAATATYGAGAVVGRISGATGATYQSLATANTNNDPATATAWWRQSSTTAYATWSSATTYGLGEYVVMFDSAVPTQGSVYKSLAASNASNSPPISPLWWEYVGTSYKRWDATATYAAGDIVIDPRTHHRYEASVGANTGKDPTAEVNRPSWWIDLGATNRWAPFDRVTSSYAEAYGSLTYTVALPEQCDTIALLGIVGAVVQITAKAGATTVYDQTFELVDNSLITDWRRWFFDPVTYRADLIVNDLPPIPGLTVTITITRADSTVELGTAAFGLASSLGATIYGAATGILDFSRKETDDFGNTVIVERPYAKRSSFKIAVGADQVDAVQQRLADLRATPVVYQGSDGYASTWVYGFYRDFTVTIEQPTVSYLNIEIEGLT